MLELLQNNQLRQTKAAGAKKLAEQYNWDRTAEAQLAFYQSVLERKHKKIN
jgi:hypothetical protein